MVVGNTEAEAAGSSVEINNESLVNRFGPDFFEDGLKREELTPFFLPANQVIPDASTPDRASHSCSWEIYRKEFEKPVFLVRLEDDFSIPKLKDGRKFENTEILKELKESPYSSQLPPKLRELGEQIEKQSDGWNLRLEYREDMDGWHSFEVDLIKQDENGKLVSLVRLDLFNNFFKVITPFGEDFNSSLGEVRDKMKMMSDWLGLAYVPELKYQFVLPEGSKLADPVRSATSFVDYFYGCLDVWKFDPTQTRIRALIGASQDEGVPILLLEDPNLSVAININNLGSEIYFVNSSQRGTIVNSHPDIFRAFSRGIENRRVSERLVSSFPRENYNDQKWLHMFVETGPNDEFILKEDFSSNKGKENLEPLIHQVEKQYGIGYGGKIDLKTSERLAKMPMYLPTINEQTAIIKEEYGDTAASKFRGAAISGLVDGIPQAMEVYESYLKLLNPAFKLTT